MIRLGYNNEQNGQLGYFARGFAQVGWVGSSACSPSPSPRAVRVWRPPKGNPPAFTTRTQGKPASDHHRRPPSKGKPAFGLYTYASHYILTYHIIYFLSYLHHYILDWTLDYILCYLLYSIPTFACFLLYTYLFVLLIIYARSGLYLCVIIYLVISLYTYLLYHILVCFT